MSLLCTMYISRSRERLLRSSVTGRCIIDMREWLVQVVVHRNMGCLCKLLGALKSVGFFVPLVIVFPGEFKVSRICAAPRRNR